MHTITWINDFLINVYDLKIKRMSGKKAQFYLGPFSGN